MIPSAQVGVVASSISTGITPFVLVANTEYVSVGANGGTTATGINTTGSKLIIVIADFSSGVTSPTISDSNNNNWTGLTRVNGASNVAQRIYYCINPIVGSGHTFTTTRVNSYCSINVLSFSSGGTVAFDVENTNTYATDPFATLTQITTGSVTPSVNNCVIIAGGALAGFAGSFAINSGFSITNQHDGGAASFGGGAAYIIQTNLGTVNPLWTFALALDDVAVITVFKNS